MRYLLLILFVSIISCRSSKKAIKNTPIKSETVIVESVKDSITIKDKVVDTQVKKDTILVTETKVLEETTIEEEKKEIVRFKHDSWTSLLQKHVSDQGNVNYKGFKTDRKALLNYITSLSENMPNDSWLKEDKLAYWINAYNAMTVDLILRHYPIKSIKDIKKPWDQRFWKLEDKWYNLNEIEHDILRKMNEPRIHFAIVCASFSCPKLQNEAFKAENIDSQLTKSTKEFLSDSSRNEISKNSIKLSKIFQWFAKDFKQEGSLIDFLNKYSETTISGKAKKNFKDYNWDLNE